MMMFPLPAEAPVILPGGEADTVHEKVVFGVTLDNEIPVDEFEHSICEEGVAVATGTGRIEMLMQLDTAEQGTPLRTDVVMR